MTALLPIMGVVFIAYLVMGVAMPVLPLHVHHGLGLGTFVVGLVAGSQFAAALISRMWAGHLADSKGAKRGVVTGLVIASAAGGFYLLSLRFLAPESSVAILLVGRVLLGVAESVIITSALIWGLTLIGPEHTGKVMSWVGTALYAAFAVGAPVGTTLYARHGFSAIAWTTAVLPIAALSLVVPLRRPVAPELHLRPSFIKVIRAVWLPGLGLAISVSASARSPPLSPCCSPSADGILHGSRSPHSVLPSSSDASSSAIYRTGSAAPRLPWCVS